MLRDGEASLVSHSTCCSAVHFIFAVCLCLYCISMCRRVEKQASRVHREHDRATHGDAIKHVCLCVPGKKKE